jgi:hypothetical protein
MSAICGQTLTFIREQVSAVRVRPSALRMVGWKALRRRNRREASSQRHRLVRRC